jgi:hypothetical protein
MNVIVACVRAGTLYPFEYVTKLRNMVGRHLKVPFELVCFTDQAEQCEGATFIDTSQSGLTGWWQKLLLFEPSWRGHNRVIYLDLDTVIVGDITPLARVPGEFAILETPVRKIDPRYPCKFNSSVMTIGGGMAAFVWTAFSRRQEELVARHDRYGDQACIEELYPSAPFLQRLLPKGFFCNYRDITALAPNAAVVNFGGAHKPHNCPIRWVQEQWA